MGKPGSSFVASPRNWYRSLESWRSSLGTDSQSEAERPHMVENGGDGPLTVLVLQGVGEYDYLPLTETA